MQRYGLYDATRGLTTAAAVGGAGVLLWAATLVGQQIRQAVLGGDGRSSPAPGSS